MKILTKNTILVLLTCFTFLVKANLDNKLVSVNYKGTSIKTVLDDLESKTNLKFVYSNSDFNDQENVTIDEKNKSVSLVLDLLTKNQKVDFTLKKNNIVTFTKISKQLTGTVVDVDGVSLPGVSVTVEGSSGGTVTDIDGKFSLLVKKRANILKFSFVGLKPQTVLIGEKVSFNVVMKEDAVGLEEIVVVGYGVQKKTDVTGSISTITTDRLESKPNANFAQALQGATSGLYMTTSSSSAEEGNVSILLRGRNSINASNDPLIVLDGVPFSGSMSEINTVDIESINILKDASSVAIYGSRGSNGVILITTKKGTSNKPTISVNSYYGITKISNMLDVYDGPEYLNWRQERFPTIWMQDGEPYLHDFEKGIVNSGKYVDWRDQVFQDGVKQEYNLSVRGGNDKTKYYISATSYNAKGIAVNDEYERYNLRVNVEQEIYDWISFGSNTQMTYSDRSGLPALSGRGYSLSPVSQVYDEDGKLAIYPIESDTYFDNPLSPTLVDNTDNTYKLVTNNYLLFTAPFIKGLTYKLNTGVEVGFVEETQYEGRNSTKSGSEKNGASYTNNANNKNVLIENIITYSNIFKEHSITFTGLYSYQKETRRGHELTGTGYPFDALTIYSPSTAGLLEPSVSYRSSVLISQMGRLNYVYDSRYILTATARRDGYTGFGDNVKYGVFPSIALGWNIHNEKFYKSDLFNSLKLRASYGKNGNQAIGPYDNLAKLSSYDGKANYVVGSTTAPGLLPKDLANSDLSWEKTTTANIGVEVGMLGGRVQTTVEVYQSKTEDLLFNATIPTVHGISSLIQNIGETQNKGIEASVKAHVLKLGDFNWNTSVNFSANKNEIVSLYGKKEDDVANRFFIGEPIKVNYALVFDGIWQQGDDIANSAQSSAVPGDVKVKDVANEGDTKMINDLDREIIGQLDPTWTWGMENTFSYKEWSLYVFMHGVNGITKHNNSKLNDNSTFSGRKNTNVKDYWTESNPNNHTPRNHQDSNPKKIVNYESADFIRIKDITLSYNLKKSWLESMKIQNLKLYFTTRNLFTISDWDGMDPEMNSQLGTPLQEEYVFGINLTF